MAETLWSKQARGSFLALRKSPDRAELYERVRQRLLILREAPGDGRVRSRRMRIKGGGVWRIDVSGSDEETDDPVERVRWRPHGPLHRPAAAELALQSASRTGPREPTNVGAYGHPLGVPQQLGSRSLQGAGQTT